MKTSQDPLNAPDHAAFAARMAHRLRQLRTTRFGQGPDSRDAAASAIDVSPSEWDAYEHGQIPAAGQLQRICAAFGCDANWLLGLPATAAANLTAAQQRIVTSLIDVQEALHAFDGMFTDCLVNLRDVLADPEIAQAQCFKLYAIANRLAQLRHEMTADEPCTDESPHAP